MPRRTLAALIVLAALPVAAPAVAHVKWFAPFIVGAAPAPPLLTLRDPRFWTALALVLVFFLATRAIERTQVGAAVLSGIDRATAPLWSRADQFMRAVIGAFFVAIFSVGGVYLTPDLQTPSEWVSWAQLLIAAGVFWRWTMPLSALGIIGLWLLALRDYDVFHLLDYLALGLATAGYLVLAASQDWDWRAVRFRVLRWGVAIALMWSSLEKFAYPDWFYPLVEEKPFLTFGLPRDIFIPMAGVAEFTLGFGLTGTPLVRRLSALALLAIFIAAVWPFGRIDLVGHALIMAILVLIVADPGPRLHHWRALRETLWGIPPGLVLALAGFATLYWGLHAVLYGPQGVTSPPGTTHAPSAEHPHDAP